MIVYHSKYYSGLGKKWEPFLQVVPIIFPSSAAAAPAPPLTMGDEQV